MFFKQTKNSKMCFEEVFLYHKSQILKQFWNMWFIPKLCKLAASTKSAIITTEQQQDVL